MQGPTNELRAHVARETEELHAAVQEQGMIPKVENRFAGLLQMIEQECAADARTVRTEMEMGAPPPEPVDPKGVYASVQAWAALTSYAVGSVYGPNSPWPRSLAGASTRVMQVLNDIAELLITPLRAAKDALGASAFSIGTQFPMASVSVSLSFSN